MIIEKILDYLDVFYEDLAKKKHGCSPSISYGDLITRIVLSKGNCSAHTLFPEIGEQTFNRLMRKQFATKINGGNQTWYFYLLSLINYKLCRSCNKELPFLDFHKDSNGSSIGLNSTCKLCISIQQVGQYNKYIFSHKKSYEKNYPSIRARQQLYKGERSLRVPCWYETQKRQIEEFYSMCPPGMQVDHIIPLKGELVSGLHVIQNLQYLSIKDNLSKGNKYAVS